MAPQPPTKEDEPAPGIWAEDPLADPDHFDSTPSPPKEDPIHRWTRKERNLSSTNSKPVFRGTPSDSDREVLVERARMPVPDEIRQDPFMYDRSGALYSDSHEFYQPDTGWTGNERTDFRSFIRDHRDDDPEGRRGDALLVKGGSADEAWGARVKTKNIEDWVRTGAPTGTKLKLQNLPRSPSGNRETSLQGATQQQAKSSRPPWGDQSDLWSTTESTGTDIENRKQSELGNELGRDEVWPEQGQQIGESARERANRLVAIPRPSQINRGAPQGGEGPSDRGYPPYKGG